MDIDTKQIKNLCKIINAKEKHSNTLLLNILLLLIFIIVVVMVLKNNP